MKKYLVLGATALVLASCNSHDFTATTQADMDKMKYDAAFLSYVGGSIDQNQDWGFGEGYTRGAAITRAAAAGSTVATQNATLFNDWSDQKTYVTCDEGETVMYQVTWSVDAAHPVADQLDILSTYYEVLPEQVNNLSKIASTNKEEFITTAEGEISYTVLPGVTSGTADRIGYYYYTESCNIKKLHKFVLTNDPSDSYIGNGNQVDFKDEAGNYLYTGWEKKFKTYKLVYVDEAGNASYTFPAGVNVGFFTQTVEAGSQTTVELYSNGSLNKEISEWLGENSYDGEGWKNSATNSHVAIFSYKGYNFVGFEDWYDYDYNDMVLSVVGNIEPATTVNIEEEDEEEEDEPAADVIRIIAEDLSASSASDFDFNDIVLDVKFGTPAVLTLRAAGGTLPLRINGDDNLEVHKLFGVWPEDVETIDENTPALTMVNTYAGKHNQYAPVVIDASKGFTKSITTRAEANDLKIEVFKHGTWQTLTAVKGEPACKLAVDTSFNWLDERQSIKGVYPSFIDWATDANFTSKWW